MLNNVRKITVALIDCKQLYREGMKHIINADSSLHFIVEGKTKNDAFRLIDNYKPDVLIIDSHLIEMHDLNNIKRNLLIASKPEIILLADDMYSKKYFIEAVNAGIKGFLLQDLNDGLFVQAIKTVYKKQYWIHPKMSHYLMLVFQSQNQKLNVTKNNRNAKKPLHTLTKREFEVLELLVMGYGNDAIITKLNISDATVKTHIRHILYKLNVTNRTQAVILAIQNKWVEFDLQSNTFDGIMERR